MRATATLTTANFRLQESADQPLQRTLPAQVDPISHHDRHHAARGDTSRAVDHSPSWSTGLLARVLSRTGLRPGAGAGAKLLRCHPDRHAEEPDAGVRGGAPR